MDRPVRKRCCERVVDQAVLLDKREAVEALALNRHLEVVAATRTILDGEAARVGKGPAEKRFERVGSGHGAIVARLRFAPG